MTAQREAMEYDVVIVGAGPAGLATAIRLKQLAAEAGAEVSVCVLEKGSEPGAHILSGAVMDPRAITELVPDWKARGRAARHAGHRATAFLFLLETRSKAIRTRTGCCRSCFQNDGNYVISLGNVGTLAGDGRPKRWASRSSPASPRAEVLYDDDGAVRGVATGNMGVGKDGEPHDDFQLGHGAARQVHDLRRRRARPSRQAGDREVQPRRRPRPAELGPSASRSCGRSPPTRPQPGLVLHTRRLAARPTTPTAAASCTTSKATRSRSASSSASTTRTRT